MIDVKLLENPQTRPETGRTYREDYELCLQRRGDDVGQVERLIELQRERKLRIQEAESLKAHQNKVSQIIAQKKKAKEDCAAELGEMQKISSEIKILAEKAAEAEARQKKVLVCLPNWLHPDVPAGKSDTDNVVHSTWGEPRKFNFEPRDHVDIGEKLGGIDSQRAGKVTGARFTFLKGGVARLERALIQFMLDIQTKENGHTEIIPPYIVNSDSLFGTGNFPKFQDDVFHLVGTDYHLIPTAEVPVTNYFRDEILREEDLPCRFVAFSPCFRSEAGSYGRDTRGLIRQHQFHKVELMTFVHPQHSDEEHERLTANAEMVLKRLELPFQRVILCSGDISFGAMKCYDLNVWLPAQKAYREISSCSNFGDFQARRANIRFKPSAGAGSGAGKPAFVHTLNGSGLAVGRTLVAILENYQQEDGSVVIPQALRPYMDGSAMLGARP